MISSVTVSSSLVSAETISSSEITAFFSARFAEVNTDYNHALYIEGGHNDNWPNSYIMAASLSVGYKFPIKQKSTKKTLL